MFPNNKQPISVGIVLSFSV